jgi:hypothetical protein
MLYDLHYKQFKKDEIMVIGKKAYCELQATQCPVGKGLND